MIKHYTILALLSVCLANSYATPCERWEYAKFKDATKQELSDEYCTSAAHAIANSEVAQARNKAAKGFTERKNYTRANQLIDSAYQASMEQVSCMKQVEASEAMLKKKFKASPPNKCKHNYDKAMAD